MFGDFYWTKMSKQKFIKSIEVSLKEKFLRDNQIDKTFLRNSCRNADISESSDGKIVIRGNYEEIKELHEKLLSLQKKTSAQDVSSGANYLINGTGISADTKTNITAKTMSTCNGMSYENEKDAKKYFKKSVNRDHVITGRPPLSAVRATKLTIDCNNITNRRDRLKEPTKKKSEVIHKSPERKRMKYRHVDTSFTYKFQNLNIKKSEPTDQIDGPESVSMILDMPCDDDINRCHLLVPTKPTSQSISTFREQRQCLETEPYGMIQVLNSKLVTHQPSFTSDAMNSSSESPRTSGLPNERNSESMKKNMPLIPMDSFINYPSYQSDLSSETIREDRSPMPMDSFANLPSCQSDLSSETIREDRFPMSMDSFANLPSYQSDLSSKMIRENGSLNSNTDSFVQLPVISLNSERFIQDASLGSKLDLDGKVKDIEESFIVLETNSFSLHED